MTTEPPLTTTELLTDLQRTIEGKVFAAIDPNLRATGTHNGAVDVVRLEDIRTAFRMAHRILNATDPIREARDDLAIADSLFDQNSYAAQSRATIGLLRLKLELTERAIAAGR